MLVYIALIFPEICSGSLTRFLLGGGLAEGSGGGRGVWLSLVGRSAFLS